MPICEVNDETDDALSEVIIEQCQAMNMTEAEISVALANVFFRFLAATGNDSLEVDNKAGWLNVELKQPEDV